MLLKHKALIIQWILIRSDCFANIKLISTEKTRIDVSGNAEMDGLKWAARLWVSCFSMKLRNKKVKAEKESKRKDG